jgi:hypothetical protein
MSADERQPGEAWCRDCPDHEACATGWRCDDVKRIDAKENAVSELLTGQPVVGSPGDGGGNRAVLRARAYALATAAQTLEDAAGGLARLVKETPGDDSEGIDYAIAYLRDLAALRRRQSDAAIDAHP